MENQAHEGLRSQFIFDKIAEKEEVSVGETELSAWLIQQAPRYGMCPDQFAQMLADSGHVPMTIQDIRRAKALDEEILAASHRDAVDRFVELDEEGNVVVSFVVEESAVEELIEDGVAPPHFNPAGVELSWGSPRRSSHRRRSRGPLSQARP